MFEFKNICKQAQLYNKLNKTNLTYVEYFLMYKSERDSLSDLPYLIALDLKKIIRNTNFDQYPFINKNVLIQSHLFDSFPLQVENHSVTCLIREDEIHPFSYSLNNKGKKCGPLIFYFSGNEYFIFEDKYNVESLKKHVNKYLKDHNKIIITTPNLSQLVNICFAPKGSSDNYIDMESLLKSSNQTKNLLCDVFNQFVKEMSPYSIQSLFNINKNTFDFEKIKNTIKTSDIHLCKDESRNIHIYEEFVSFVFSDFFTFHNLSQKNDGENILIKPEIFGIPHDDLVIPEIKILLKKNIAYLMIEDYKKEHDSEDVFMNIYNSIKSIHEYINNKIPNTDKIIKDIITNLFNSYGIEHKDEFLIKHDIKNTGELYLKIPFEISFPNNSQCFELEVFEMLSTYSDKNNSSSHFNKYLSEEKKENIKNKILTIKSLAESSYLKKNILISPENETLKKRL